MKSAFQSLTVQSGLLTVVISLGVACAQPATNLICRGAGENSRLCLDSKDYRDMLIGVAGVLGVGAGVGAVAGRLRVGDVYTPHGLPGADKEWLEQSYLESIADVVVDSLPVPEAEDIPQPVQTAAKFGGSILERLIRR